MTKKTLIWIVIGWVLLMLLIYYYAGLLFVHAYFWLIAVFFTITFIQLIQLFRERKNTTKLRIQKLVVFSCLLLLTLSPSLTYRLIEKVDWFILENKRAEIVKQVKDKKLKPDVGSNTCKLPFEFPIVSKNRNYILILNSKTDDALTIHFWVDRQFDYSASTSFVYSNDKSFIERFEYKITERPKENWKLKENWYRIHGGS